MANLTIQLDEGAIREATVQALVGHLTPEAKTKLIEGAIQSILTRDRGAYGTDLLPLERAFRSAVQDQVHKIAQEMVTADPALTGKLRELMADAMARMLTYTDEEARTVFVAKMADAFVNSLQRG